MRSRAEAVALAALICLLSPLAPAADAVKYAPPASTVLSPAQSTPPSPIFVMTRTSAVKPRSVRFAGSPARSRSPASTSPDWLIGLFEYAGRFGGLLLWAAGAVAAAIAAVWILRLLKSREPRASTARPDPGDADGAVLDLDIRPDSLPEDVSAAALELLRAGRVRDSLSLLYRASLSSAVHRFGATIGAHHTEREVLGAVKGALDEPRARYFADLVAIWQRVVYAGEILAPDAVMPLCAGFSTFLDPPPP